MTDTERKIKRFATIIKYEELSDMLDALRRKSEGVRKRIHNTLMKNLTEEELAMDTEDISSYLVDWLNDLDGLDDRGKLWEAQTRKAQEKKSNDNG